MNEKMKFFVAIMVFGSLWGFSECIIGPQLSDAGLSPGVIMTGFFAMILLTMSRLFYKKKGMQFGMGLVAGSLRYFNPFGGCQVCSSIAIVAEALIFELIFDYLSTIDVGLLVLLKNTRYNRSKSPTKLFEYMAMGLATISTKVGESKNVIEHGKNGLLVGTKSDFRENVIRLIKGEFIIKELGERAKQTIRTKYSLIVLGKELSRIIKENID